MQQTPRGPRAARRPLAAYIRDITSAPLLSAQAERRLAQRVGAGDWEARDRMVRANLRLVVRLACCYTGKGLPLEDLVAEGNLGLMRAAELFDPSRGVRFSTYAGHWVRQSIRRALTNTSRTVRLPSYMLDLLSRWHRAAAALREELGRPATEDEVARRVGLAGKRLKVVREAARTGNAVPHEGTAAEPESLSSLVCQADGGPDERLAQLEELNKALSLLGGMDPRHAEILRLRFGLAGEGPLSRGEVSARLGLTRERVRQIEVDGLRQLRAGLTES